MVVVGKVVRWRYLKGPILYEAESELVTYVTVVTLLIITDITSVTLRTSYWYPSLAQHRQLRMGTARP